MTKIGIYAGTFDPIHNGHLAFANIALHKVGLDKIFFLVEPSPRHKQGVRAFEHRTKMVQLAIKDQPSFGDIILEQPRFTVQDTLPILQKRFYGNDLYMLLGEDILAHLIAWPQVDSLMEAVNFIIGARNNERDEIAKTIKTIEKTKGTKLRTNIISGEFSDVSSSKVRQALRKNGISDSVPTEIIEYIKKESLYTSA